MWVSLKFSVLNGLFNVQFREDIVGYSGWEAIIQSIL